LQNKGVALRKLHDRERRRLHSMRRLGLYVAVMLIPGTALTLPLLAWWLDRRHTRRAYSAAEVRQVNAE
jgi:hypothetical protein